jgi:RHS repeat-associated protein
LGSTNVTSDPAGNQVSLSLYTAWGESRLPLGGTSLTDYKFTGQRADSYIKLDWYGSRWYDSELGRFTQPDSIVPDPVDPRAYDRYSYAANNPVTHTDPSGHCWGIASGIRGLPIYDTTCQNLDMALTIVKSDQTSLGQKDLAITYMVAEGTFHATLAAGVAMLVCSAVAPCAKAAATALGIGEAACADGDCTNEAQLAQNGIEIVQKAANDIPTAKINPYLDLGSAGKNGSGLLHILERHSSTANTTNASHFGSDISVTKLYELIKSSGGDINLWTKQANSYIRDIDVGSVIGTDLTGQATTWMRVVVDSAGRVITTYPVEVPEIP